MIDPRRETLRVRPWLSTRSLMCLELTSRKPSWPAFMCERNNRPDVWTQAMRSSHLKISCEQGAVHVWAYRSSENSDEPIVLLDYQPGRGQIYPQTFLGDYRGILVTDGYTAWRTLNGATHVGCMAHSRRRFVDALKARKNGGGPPEQALRFFEQLYRIERQARDKTPDPRETKADCIRRFRQQHSLPVLNALKAWLDNIAPKIVPDTKLGDAVSYTLNQWSYLTRYTSDGRMPIDNNILEREIRVFATGRKSWLFSDTADGAKASAVIYSLMLTCRACGVDPLTWLRHVLTELPQREETADIGDLLPFNFSKANAQ